MSIFCSCWTHIQILSLSVPAPIHIKLFDYHEYLNSKRLLATWLNWFGIQFSSRLRMLNFQNMLVFLPRFLVNTKHLLTLSSQESIVRDFKCNLWTLDSDVVTWSMSGWLMGNHWTIMDYHLDYAIDFDARFRCQPYEMICIMH